MERKRSWQDKKDPIDGLRWTPGKRGTSRDVLQEIFRFLVKSRWRTRLGRMKPTRGQRMWLKEPVLDLEPFPLSVGPFSRPTTVLFGNLLNKILSIRLEKRLLITDDINLNSLCVGTSLYERLSRSFPENLF